MPRFPFSSFPAELEGEFQSFYAGHSVAVARMGALLGVGLYMAFLFWDHVVAPDLVPMTLAIRVAVSAYFIACWALLRKRSFLPWMQGLFSLGVSMAGIGVTLIIYQMPGGMIFGLAGLVVILMFNFGFLRLLFLPALAAGLVIVGSYNLAGIIKGLPATTLITNNFFLVSALFAGATITYTIERLYRAHFINQRKLVAERERADALIDNMLPRPIASRLKAGEEIAARSHGEATVLFADIIHFTELSKMLSAGQLIEMLDDLFSLYDGLTVQHGVEKVKTIGDAYMAVSGLDKLGGDSAEAMAEFALAMVRATDDYAKKSGYPLAIRVGISTGPVVAGVLGNRRISFDVWGETVNKASRIETHAGRNLPMVTDTTYWRLRDRFEMHPRGKIDLKGIGPVEAYELRGRKVCAANDAGRPLPEYHAAQA